jgi:dihydrodipicolinate synthase/N-acetylneuraminate lyase
LLIFRGYFIDGFDY